MPKIDDKNLEKEIRTIISEVTEIEPERIALKTNFVDDLGMDSMMALEILAAVEKKYKIQIPEDKLMRLKNLEETIKLTKEYLSQE